MKHVLLLALISAALACGGPDEPQLSSVEIGAQNPEVTPDEPPHDVVYARDGLPYFEAVSQETDELMNLVEDNRDLFPEDKPMPLHPAFIYPLLEEKRAALAAGRPMEVQKWHSAVFHGVAANGVACYSQQMPTGAGNKACYFPRYKNQLILPGGNPSQGPALCGAAGLGARMPKAQADWFMWGFWDGYLLQERQNIDMWIRMNVFPAGIHNWVPNTIACNNAEPQVLASTRIYWQAFGARQAGLPAHNGVDPSGAWQNIDNQTVAYPVRLYKMLLSSCGFTAPQLANSTDIINSFGKAIGAHEFLHSIGFSHFTSGIMKPKVECTTRATSINATMALMTQPFVDAMTVYSGGPEGDDGIIHDVGLPSPYNEPAAPEDVDVFSHG